jgi:hypothetical protein
VHPLPDQALNFPIVISFRKNIFIIKILFAFINPFSSRLFDKFARLCTKTNPERTLPITATNRRKRKKKPVAKLATSLCPKRIQIPHLSKMERANVLQGNTSFIWSSPRRDKTKKPDPRDALPGPKKPTLPSRSIRSCDLFGLA